MISENQVELVIKYNLRAKSLRENQFWWNPGSTSTPIRKPLNPLTNVEVVSDCKQYNYLSNQNNRYVVPSKSNKLQDNEQINKINSLEKDKDEDFYNVLSSDEDESDVKKSKLPKKNLVIKLGNSCNKTSKNKVKKKNESNCISSPEKKFKSEINGSINTVIEDNVKHIKTQNVSAPESINNSHKKNEDNDDDDDDVQIIDNEVKEVSANCNFVTENDDSKKIVEQTDIQNNRDKKLNSKNVNKMLSKKRKDVDTSLKNKFVKKLKSAEENLNDSNINKNKIKRTSKNLTLSKNQKTNSDLKKKVDAEIVYQKQNHSDKSSTSHEIFSDSKEQELRDSLNLTNSDIEESYRIDNSEDSCLKSPKIQKLPFRHKYLGSRKNKNSIKTDILNNSFEVIQEKRTIKSPRQFWLPRSETCNNSSPKKHVLEKEDNVKQKKEDSAKISSSMCSPSSKTIKTKILKSKNKEPTKVLQNRFIKDVSKMKFVKKAKGGNHEFLAAVGWELSSFKCSILKIPKSSEVIGKTKEENRHCGGVILKGKLLMKVQDEEMEVKQGRIFHIPPLTDWKMFNNGRIECVVYYWRGRF